MRLLLIGAFPYPHDQGSQVYFQEQALALRASGAEVELLTYGPSADSAIARASDACGPAPDPDRWRALDGFVHHSLPAWARPATGRSGPSRAKLLADIALAWRLTRCARSAQDASGFASRTPPGVASKTASETASSARAPSDPRPSSPRYDAVLAHHVEAAALAMASLPQPRPPLLFCPHTLLEQELPLYLNPLKSNDSLARSGDFPGAGDEPDGGPLRASRAARAAAAIGGRIDWMVARRADGWIALTQSAERVMRASCNGSGAAGAHMPIGARIAPPIPDPRCAAFWPARQHELEATARGLGLEPNHFFLYAGNLDPYQDLPLLTELARARAGRRGLPIVLATHDPRARTLDRVAGVRVVELARTAPLQALVAAARATLVPRRALGGFPIKLANSLALGTPAIAFHADEWGLADGRDALIADRARPVHSLATALDRLERDAGLAERLRVGARATWARQHAPGSVAEATLDLIERVQQAMRRRRTLHDDATHDDAMTAQGSGTSGPRRAT